MKCNFEVEHIFVNTLSFEEIQKIICKKIARVIIHKEQKICTLESGNK